MKHFEIFRGGERKDGDAFSYPDGKLLAVFKHSGLPYYYGPESEIRETLAGYGCELRFNYEHSEPGDDDLKLGPGEPRFDAGREWAYSKVCDILERNGQALVFDSRHDVVGITRGKTAATVRGGSLHRVPLRLPDALPRGVKTISGAEALSGAVRERDHYYGVWKFDYPGSQPHHTKYAIDDIDWNSVPHELTAERLVRE